MRGYCICAPQLDVPLDILVIGVDKGNLKLFTEKIILKVFLMSCFKKESG